MFSAIYELAKEVAAVVIDRSVQATKVADYTIRIKAGEIQAIHGKKAAAARAEATANAVLVRTYQKK